MGKLGQRVISYSIVPLVMTISACSAIYQQVVATARHPGEQIATTPDKVWQELNCAKRERPFVQVERMEVLPEMIKPGGRVNYRLVYVLCPLKPSEVLKTRLVRNMLFKGERVGVMSKIASSLSRDAGLLIHFLHCRQNLPLVFMRWRSVLKLLTANRTNRFGVLS